jgi:polysaccharide biosynthesis transport protein
MADMLRGPGNTGGKAAAEKSSAVQAVSMNTAAVDAASPAPSSAARAAVKAGIAGASGLGIPPAEQIAEPQSRFGEPWDIPTPVKVEKGPINSMVLACHQPRSQAGEQFRQLRTTLIRLAGNGPVRCMITSARPREGKTVVSANLAYSFSELAQKRTLVIDGDLRRGRMSELFGLPNNAGLGELLSGKASPQEVCRAVGRPSLHVLTAGKANLDSIGELLGSTSAQIAMRDLFSQYDYVLLDTPPVLGLADTGMLGAWTDVALLIVRIHKTPRNLIDKSAHVLANSGINMAGIVALDDQAHDANGYYDGYGYYG